jgi:hypothetical protein
MERVLSDVFKYINKTRLEEFLCMAAIFMAERVGHY